MICELRRTTWTQAVQAITLWERELRESPVLPATSEHAGDLDDVGDWSDARVDDICSH
jgi:hypothetical protein